LHHPASVCFNSNLADAEFTPNLFIQLGGRLVQ